MVTTRRSSRGKRPNCPDPFQDRKQQRVLGTQSVGIRRLGRGMQECHDLVCSVLEQSTHGLWFRILPVDGFDDDISIGTGVDWQYLLPLLTKCGLIRSRVASMVQDVECDSYKWDELAKASVSRMKMEITCIRTRHARQALFYCIGKPSHKSPLYQQRAFGAKMLVPFPRVPSRVLMEAVKKTAKEVIDERLVSRMQPDSPTIDEEQVECIATSVMNHINYALALDLDRRPRLSRTNAENIVVHSRRRPDERYRNMVLHTAIMWGWHDPCLTVGRRNEIAMAACRQVAYDMGYSAPFAHTRLPVWYGMLNSAIVGGEKVDSLSPSTSDRPNYIARIERQHPGYLRELFRYAERVLGATSTWHELANTINEKSAAPGEERVTLSISRRQLASWFQNAGGREVSAIEKPLLTTKHKEQRIEWARRWATLLSDPSAPVAFLDEKWFYTTNRRRTMKILPATSDESAHVQPYRPPRIRSRRHPAKVMFLGVVACPQSIHRFDGRVCLHRVSKTKILARASRNKRFSVDVDVVQAIVSGEWIRHIATDGMTVDELLEQVATQYDLDAYISSRLTIGYEFYSERKIKKWKTLEQWDVIDELGTRMNKNGEQVAVGRDDLELFVQQEAGDEVEEDISCDSTFMLRKIPEVGFAFTFSVSLDSTKREDLPYHGQCRRARYQ